MVTFDLRQSLAYTNTVSKPVSKKAHHTQFPETPFVRTISVTKLGVSVEKVVATMENPKSHQGIFRPDKKNSDVFFPEVLEAISPMTKTKVKNPNMMA